MAMKKRRKVTRQEWTPNPVFRVLQGIWSAAWSVLKIALGAGAVGGNDMAMKKRRKVTRQEWTPNPVFRVLQGIWSAAWSVLKIALGAGATVAFIVVICGFVLAGAMGDYLQNEIVPNVNFELDKYDLEQTSYIYYVDNNGDIQRLQKIYTDTDRQWASYEEIPEDLVHAAVAIEDKRSYIYYVDNNGDIQRLQKIYTDTDRQWASYEEIPEDLVHAAVAIEDKRFYEHQGVDWITTVKACGNMFFGGSSTFGGSTITQQLVKNQSGDNAITVQRKVEEIFRSSGRWRRSSGHRSWRPNTTKRPSWSGI